MDKPYTVEKVKSVVGRITGYVVKQGDRQWNGKTAQEAAALREADILQGRFPGPIVTTAPTILMVALTNRMVAVRVAVVAAPLRVSFRALRISRPHIPLTSSTGIPTEMADELIRVLHFCGKHGIDIEKAVIEKMAFNDSRPYKHGGKKI